MFQLAAPVTCELDVKKSRFIGHLYPVTSRSEARVILATLRAEHPLAVHVCWALLCDGESGLDDDGEPSGTAARPMANVLNHKQLGNVLAVVVRYWGGIKLGAGGLARAYGQAISEACKAAQLVAIEVTCDARLAIKFADESTLRHLCQQFAVSVMDVRYVEQVIVHVRMKQASAADFQQTLRDALRGELVVLND